MKRLSWAASLILLCISSGYAVGDTKVALHCESVMKFTCQIAADGDFSSNCDLIKDFFETYYQNKQLKQEYKAKAPISIPSTTSYECSDGSDRFSTKAITLAPGETKQLTIQAATCQPDIIEQKVKFKVADGPVIVKVQGIPNTLGMSQTMNMTLADGSTQDVAWTHNVNGSTNGCEEPVVFSFSAPMPPPAPPVEAAPAPAPAVPLLPPSTP